MRKVDTQRSKDLHARLQKFAKDDYPLPGIAEEVARESLVRQMIDSFHRIEFVKRLGDRPLDPRRTDPASNLFDPIRAAHLHFKNGDLDEAAWLVFLATHFGPSRNRKKGWELTRRVYGALNNGPLWTWARVSANPAAFRIWFEANADNLAGIPTGSHRKYVSMRAHVKDSLADTVESYVAWVGPNRGHALLFADAQKCTKFNPSAAFDVLYKSMNVVEFGRTGRFDYLTMAGKLNLTDIEPGEPYLQGATGPLACAKLLFKGDANAKVAAKVLSAQVIQLGKSLGVGMQVMEDSLCNWQKSQQKYLPFRG